MVVGPEAARGQPRKLRLVEARVTDEADGERSHLPAVEQARHDADDDGRIDAAGEKCAQRHVRFQAPLDGGDDEIAHVPRGLVERRQRVGSRAERRLPIHVDARRAPTLEHEPRGRRQLQHVAMKRLRRRHEAVGQIVGQHRLVDGARMAGGVERTDRRGEAEQPAALAVEQRLLARAIAGEQQPAAPRVPHGEREHPVEALDDSVAPGQVAAQNRLGVGA